MIEVGEEEIEELEKDADQDLLRHDTEYIIKTTMLKTLKFVRDSND